MSESATRSVVTSRFHSAVRRDPSPGRTSARAFLARGLCKRFGKRRVLERLDLDVEPGRVTALLGENGAGKSTLLKLALGVLRADAGTVRVNGFDPILHPKPLRQSVGYVPDVPDAYPWMSVRDLFRFLRPQHPTWDCELADRLVAELRVPERTRFKSMSRGEGMKAMLAAALAPRPRLLLLDEPFAGLDPMVREEVLRGVIGEIRDGERTVLVATHDLDVVARLADRVAMLSGGRIVRHGTLAEVVGTTSDARAASDASAEFGDAPTKLRDAMAQVAEIAS